jgi:predicted DNA-binding transcriptional regulator YafY
MGFSESDSRGLENEGNMARGDSLARQLTLIRLLDARREVVVTDVARELGFTSRTVYRDLAVLERVGVPIYQERTGARSRWRVVEGYQRKVPLTLSFSEMLALAAGRELLSGLAGTMFHEAAISALEKIRASLPKEISTRVEAAAPRFSATMGPRHDYERASERIQEVVAAMEREETVELLYRKPRERQASTRTVDPYHLHVQAGAIYLMGWCHARKALRVFLMDRASEVRRTGRRFERRAEMSPSGALHGAFGPWSGKSERVRLRFDAEAATFAAERRVHPSQVSQWIAGGRLEMELRVPIGPALVAWVLGWGAKVEVVGPRRLRDRVKAEHARAAGRKDGRKKV